MVVDTEKQRAALDRFVPVLPDEQIEFEAWLYGLTKRVYGLTLTFEEWLLIRLGGRRSKERIP
jgi:hypothetical protein